jgi:glucoamylase
VQYFASFNVAEQIFDALITWDLLGSLEVTSVSLKFFQEFDEKIRVGKYAKGSKTYKKLTAALNEWAENTLLSLSERTPADLILPLVMDKETGKPTGPRGALRSQVAVLGSHNAYNHVIPPSWANGSQGRTPKKPGKKLIANNECHTGSGGEEQFHVGF